MKTDAEIQQDVMDELKWVPFLNSAEIGVAVMHSIVTLTGTVDSYSKKIAAEKAAKSVKGVRAVAEEIEVKLTDLGNKNDTELADVILNTIKWNSAELEDKVVVKVEGGWVTLYGEVEWEFQRSACSAAIETILGVRGITNSIKIKPILSSIDVKKKINFAFHRSATLDANKIEIESVGSTIILKGKVRSWAEKKDAENAVWMVPGVENVESNIEVDTAILAF